MNKRDPNNIRDIVSRFHSKRFSRSMTRSFHLWLLRPEDYSAKDEAMKWVWDSQFSTVAGSTYKSLDKVKNRLGMATPKKRAIPLGRTLARVAAVLLPAALVAGTYFIMQEVNRNEQWARVETRYGETGEYMLADGTSVCLNAGSSLEYPVKFRGTEREVHLTGEGFFKVAPDKRKPFTVAARNLRTTVLGTEFNIKAYDNQSHESVTVLSGSVKVATPEGTTHELTPNRHLIHRDDTGTTEVEDVDAISMTDWMNDGLVFDNSTLEDILCDIQRKYSDLNVVVDSTQLINTVYRMKFVHGESLEYMLDVIHRVTGVSYTLDGDNLTIGEK
jgi:ferric-dicitrate binding protein FerR (iron transport regulator)